MTKPSKSSKGRNAKFAKQLVKAKPSDAYTLEMLSQANKPHQPKVGHVEIPLVKILALVCNIMDPEADKTVALETFAQYVGMLSQAEVEAFVLKDVTRLPGYTCREGLRILDFLTRWRTTFFRDEKICGGEDCNGDCGDADDCP